MIEKHRQTPSAGLFSVIYPCLLTLRVSIFKEKGRYFFRCCNPLFILSDIELAARLKRGYFCLVRNFPLVV